MSWNRILFTTLVFSTLVGCGDNGTPAITAPTPSVGSSNNPVVTSSGVTVNQPRSVSGFQSVTIGVPGRLRIEHGSVGALTIVGDEAVLSVITSEVRGGELFLGLAPNTDLRLNDPLGIEYRVTVDELQRLDVNGTVDAVVRGISAPAFQARVSGSSSVTVSGTTNRQNVFLAGSSRYEARDLVSRDTMLEVSGTAWAVVHATDTLEGQVTGAAVVRYVGSPSVSVSVTGTATIGPE